LLLGAQPLATPRCSGSSWPVPLPSLRAGLFLGEQLMSRMPWSGFLHRQSKAHLVVGVVAQAEGPAAGDELKEVQNLLSRLVRQQKPSGDFASTVVRDSGRPEAWFAFDDQTDARKFGDAVDAETTDTYPGWASQRAFELLGPKLAALEASLPPPRDNPRQSETNQPQSRRLRGGPRTPAKRYDD
jgi:hypothetical protein